MWNIILIVIAAVQLVFSFISLIAADETKDVDKAIFWSKVHDGSGDAYFGLFSVYLDSNYYYGSGVYDYDKCDTNVCNNCAIAGQASTAFMVLTMVTLLVTIVILGLRTLSSYNTSTFKMISLIAGFATFLFASLAIIIWGGQCQANLYDTYSNSTVTIGSGFGLALGVVILSLFALPFDFFLFKSGPPMQLNNPLVSNGFDGQGFTASAPAPQGAYGAPAPAYGAYGAPNPMMAPQAVVKPAHCGFCGHKAAREYPSHPDEVARFCHMCGKKHIVEEGLKFCAGCGGELNFSSAKST